MFWECTDCGAINIEDSDLCGFCEVCGCTANKHYCQDQEEESA